MRPSIYQQADARRIGPAGLVGADRHYNPGLFRYDGKLWMCYRSHDDRPGSDRHCKLAIAQLDDQWRPAAQWLPLKAARTEDGRLFIHNGEPYVAFVELVSYKANVAYTCCMKYARLKLDKNGRWQVLDEWQVKHGHNDGRSREKNWQFFSHRGAIWCIYELWPKHIVLRIEGEKVVEKVESPGPVWMWGKARGGTPPILWDGGKQMMSIFHSCRSVGAGPFWWRYYGAAYTFEATPPFKITGISRKPLLAGSEMDGFAVDPRNKDFSDPLTAFPCGLTGDGVTVDDSPPYFSPNFNVLVSLGVNNWQCAIARFTPEELLLGPADGSELPRYYFKTENSSLPARVIAVEHVGGVHGEAKQQWREIPWDVPGRRGFAGTPGTGYASLLDPCEAESLAEMPGVTQITEAEYKRAMGAAA